MAETSDAGVLTLSQRVSDPLFLLLDFDLDDDLAVFVQASPADLDRCLRLSAFDFPLRDLVAVPIVALNASVTGPLPGSVNFLFHIPFCGSSYLTRHLEGGAAHLLRDPACLDAVFQTNHPQDGVRLECVRRLTLALLARRFPDMPTIVRTAGYHPSMMARLASSLACGSSLFLYAKPMTFILQVLKDARRCADLRHLMRTASGTLGHPALMDDASSAEMAALFWVQAASAALDSGGLGARTLSAEVLFENPDEALLAVAAHFAVRRDRLQGASGADRGLHAKTRALFDPEVELREHNALRQRHADILLRCEALLESLGVDDLMRRLGSGALL